MFLFENFEVQFEQVSLFFDLRREKEGKDVNIENKPGTNKFIFVGIEVGFHEKSMSTINKLSIRGIRSFGTQKEDEQVRKFRNILRQTKYNQNSHNLM